jgi:hypothetical protein
VLFEIAASANSDYAKLTKEERRLFKQAVAVFNVTADQFAETGDAAAWPKKLRVKSVTHAPGIYEMTWSFSGPDGRATWEWISLEDDSGQKQPAVRWRRIGGHAIFKAP